MANSQKRRCNVAAWTAPTWQRGDDTEREERIRCYLSLTSFQQEKSRSGLSYFRFSYQPTHTSEASFYPPTTEDVCRHHSGLSASRTKTRTCQLAKRGREGLEFKSYILLAKMYRTVDDKTCNEIPTRQLRTTSYDRKIVRCRETRIPWKVHRNITLHRKYTIFPRFAVSFFDKDCY